MIDYGNDEVLQKELLIKIAVRDNSIKEMRTDMTDRFDKMEQRYRIMGRTLLIIALETVKDKKRRKLLEDILEEEVKLETKKHDKT